jgi:hypothetical protein
MLGNKFETTHHHTTILESFHPVPIVFLWKGINIKELSHTLIFCNKERTPKVWGIETLLLASNELTGGKQ